MWLDSHYFWKQTEKHFIFEFLSKDLFSLEENLPKRTFYSQTKWCRYFWLFFPCRRALTYEQLAEFSESSINLVQSKLYRSIISQIYMNFKVSRIPGKFRNVQKSFVRWPEYITPVNLSLQYGILIQDVLVQNICNSERIFLTEQTIDSLTLSTVPIVTITPLNFQQVWKAAICSLINMLVQNGTL